MSEGVGINCNFEFVFNPDNFVFVDDLGDLVECLSLLVAQIVVDFDI